MRADMQPVEMSRVDPRFRKPPHGWHLNFNAAALTAGQPGLEACQLSDGGIIFMADQVLARTLQQNPHFLHDFIPEERPDIDTAASNN